MSAPNRSPYPGSAPWQGEQVVSGSSWNIDPVLDTLGAGTDWIGSLLADWVTGRPPGTTAAEAQPQAVEPVLNPYAMFTPLGMSWQDQLSLMGGPSVQDAVAPPEFLTPQDAYVAALVSQRSPAQDPPPTETLSTHPQDDPHWVGAPPMVTGPTTPPSERPELPEQEGRPDPEPTTQSRYDDLFALGSDERSRMMENPELAVRFVLEQAGLPQDSGAHRYYLPLANAFAIAAPWTMAPDVGGFVQTPDTLPEMIDEYIGMWMSTDAEGRAQVQEMNDFFRAQVDAALYGEGELGEWARTRYYETANQSSEEQAKEDLWRHYALPGLIMTGRGHLTSGYKYMFDQAWADYEMRTIGNPQVTFFDVLEEHGFGI